ncbi:MAG: type VI secretion system tip protein VgrG [Thiomicrorhabdus sp.]|nr:type VI secretion system tip protein VgrG [Thiomicrorhabdus sp.]
MKYRLPRRGLKFQSKFPLSTPYQGNIQVASRNTKINPTDSIGHQVILSIHHKYDANIRYFVGTLKQMIVQDIVDGWAYYTLLIEPDLQRLSLTSNARVFQQQTVPDIVKKILKEHGLVDYEFRTQDDHPPREYCVQYQETNLAFIERLLAEEGFFYFWEHSKSGAKLIVIDHSSLGSVLLEPNIEYNPDPSVVLKGQFMYDLDWTESLGTTDIKQRDYCFKNPRYNQEHTLYQARLGGEPDVYEQYNPYGRYKDDGSGKRFTKYQLEAERNAITHATVHSNVPHLSAGHGVTLLRHPNTNRNQTYQVITTIHTGTQPQATEARNDTQSQDTRYHNASMLFPLGAYSWRNKIPTKPTIDGPQIAHVVGPQGEEIYCDEHGRVKVQFPWDIEGQYDDFSSCWVRVSQGSAGAGWGNMAIPRVGQEVMVKFLEGDPDQPIIMGRTHDAVNPLPHALPQHKTRMSIKSKTHKGTGFNELRFEDKKGEEEIYVHAEKDYRRLIKNNEIVKIEGELKVNVIQASEKKAKSIQITANDFIEFNLGANQIKMTPTQITVAGTKITIKGQGITTIQGGMVKINAGGGGASQAKTNLDNMAVEPKAGEFGGFKANETKEFGINKSVEPVQVASSGSQVPDDFGSGAIEPLFFPTDMLGDLSPRKIFTNIVKNVFGNKDKSDSNNAVDNNKGNEKDDIIDKKIKSVDLIAHRKDHILNRHRAGTGKSGKTEFPANWNDEKILQNISDIAKDPNSIKGVGKWNSPYVTGVRDGIEIRVDFYPKNHPKYAGQISTAYPTNVRPNP